MKLIIDIPEDVIESAKSSPNYYPTYHFEKIWKAIANGTPLPKAGHWEWLTDDKYRCSNCRHETRVDEYFGYPMYNFCPFCRARMESGEE